MGRLGRAAGGEPADRAGAARRAKAAHIVLEVEIGVVGGEEDGVDGEIDEQLYTTPEDALATVAALGTGENGRYLAALTFGNVHGVYKPGNVKLRPEILKAPRRPSSRSSASRPARSPSTWSSTAARARRAEEIGAAVDFGVIKMNVDTDTQYAFTRPIAGAHVQQLRRRAQGRRRGRQQEDLRPARLGQGRRGRHGRPRRRGVPEPALGRRVS